MAGTATGGIKRLAYSDQGGRPDGVQAMYSRGHLFVGHMYSNGFTVLDVNDPRAPKPVKFVAAPPNTRTHHLQAFDNLLLVVAGADIPTISTQLSLAETQQTALMDVIAQLNSTSNSLFSKLPA